MWHISMRRVGSGIVRLCSASSFLGLHWMAQEHADERRWRRLSNEVTKGILGLRLYSGLEMMSR